MICYGCGEGAPTRAAYFMSVNSYIIHCSYSYYSSKLCKKCIVKAFAKNMIGTFLLGWWSIPGLLLTPIAIIINLSALISSISLPSVPPNTPPPPLSEATINKISPFNGEIAKLIQMEGNTLDAIARQIAKKAGVTNDEVATYIFAMVELAQLHKSASSRGKRQ